MSTPGKIDWDLQLSLKALGQKVTNEPAEQAGLAASANAAFESINCLKVYDKTCKERLVLHVLEAGYRMIRLRELVGDAEWIPFIKERFPTTSLATIYRYESIAKAFPDPTNLPDRPTVSKLYRASRRAEDKGCGKKSIAIQKVLKRLAKLLAETDTGELKAIVEASNGELIQQLSAQILYRLKELEDFPFGKASNPVKVHTVPNACASAVSNCGMWLPPYPEGKAR